MAKILLAGEDLAILDNVEATVSAEGHEVLTAMNGLDAYEMTLAEQPDLLVLEVTMPVFNGFETCEMVREDPEIAETLPIVLLAGEEVDVRKMEQVQATEQLPKLHQSIELRDLLVRLLGEKAGGDHPA